MEFNLNPSTFAADKNFKSLDENKIYDVLIIGGGPAGLTAAVYCMRKGIATGLILKDIGGQVAETSGIENYMGYRYINGIELAAKFKEQVLQFGIDYEEGALVQSLSDGDIKKVTLEDGRAFSAKTLIIATGKSSRKLNVPGEKELTGKGVAYCSICDAPFYKNKKVIVAGGGNSALEAVLDLAKVASHVTVLQFLDKLTADKVLIEKMNGYDTIDVIYEHEVMEIKGKDTVESVRVKDRKSGSEREIETDGIFVEIGLLPNSGFAKGHCDLNQFDEIQIDCSCATSSPGIFAAGDVTSVPFKQIIIAGGEGAKAALSAYDYVLKH